MEKAILSKEDRSLVESQPFDPLAKPSYESIKSCLIWPDEFPFKLSSEGHKRIHTLLACRSYMHRRIPLIGRLEYLRQGWEEAVSAKLNWNGFKRVSISNEDLAYLLEQIKLETEAGCV